MQSLQVSFWLFSFSIAHPDTLTHTLTLPLIAMLQLTKAYVIKFLVGLYQKSFYVTSSLIPFPKLQHSRSATPAEWSRILGPFWDLTGSVPFLWPWSLRLDRSVGRSAVYHNFLRGRKVMYTSMLLMEHFFCLFAGMLSACCNPVVYGLLNENFKTEFRNIFKPCCRTKD